MRPPSQTRNVNVGIGNQGIRERIASTRGCRNRGNQSALRRQRAARAQRRVPAMPACVEAQLYQLSLPSPTQGWVQAFQYLNLANMIEIMAYDAEHEVHEPVFLAARHSFV